MGTNRKTTILITAIVLIGLTGCSSGGYDNCVKGMVEEGYSLEEAQELCHDAEVDSQIR